MEKEETVDAEVEKVKAAQKEEEQAEVDPMVQLQTQVDELKNKNILLLAEMENARKRMQKEKADMNRFAVENVIGDFLSPMDQMERALSAADNVSDEVKNWAIGFDMIMSQFKEVLTQNGVSPFNSEGEFFDPYKHEAVETVETEDHPHGYILKEFVKGYKSGDRVVRAARVKIAKAPMKEEAAPSADASEEVKENESK